MQGYLRLAGILSAVRGGCRVCGGTLGLQEYCQLSGLAVGLYGVRGYFPQREQSCVPGLATVMSPVSARVQE